MNLLLTDLNIASNKPSLNILIELKLDRPMCENSRPTVAYSYQLFEYPAEVGLC